MLLDAPKSVNQHAIENFGLWTGIICCVHAVQIVDPFNETALEVFARISALRDELDGPPVRPHSPAACLQQRCPVPAEACAWGCVQKLITDH